MSIISREKKRLAERLAEAESILRGDATLTHYRAENRRLRAERDEARAYANQLETERDFPGGPHVFGPCCDHHADDFLHLVNDAETRLARLAAAEQETRRWMVMENERATERRRAWERADAAERDRDEARAALEQIAKRDQMVSGPLGDLTMHSRSGTALSPGAIARRALATPERKAEDDWCRSCGATKPPRVGEGTCSVCCSDSALD